MAPLRRRSGVYVLRLKAKLRRATHPKLELAAALHEFAAQRNHGLAESRGATAAFIPAVTLDPPERRVRSR